ncbi:hypothetical protein HK14_05110 [Acetobacter cibinongensis]|uniref:Uncharacterized protein n=1 Tax=Acetobacter cibinongensis TaxID=146475 RepID=A0A1Z5YV80_9PROT|nr:hypothetical protein HK14_05110 [Acetobacter cibinongensis]
MMRPNRKNQPFFKIMKRVHIRLGFSSCKFLVPDSAWVIRAGLHTGTQYESDEIRLCFMQSKKPSA